MNQYVLMICGDGMTRYVRSATGDLDDRAPIVASDCRLVDDPAFARKFAGPADAEEFRAARLPAPAAAVVAPVKEGQPR